MFVPPSLLSFLIQAPINTYGSGFFRITVIPYLYPQFIWIYRLPFPDPQFILPGIQLFANQLIAFFFHPETCNSIPQLISKRIFHGIKTQVINSGSHLHLIIQLIRFVSPPTDERSRQPGEITADRKPLSNWLWIMVLLKIQKVN